MITMKNNNQEQRLCKECGLCCNGTLFRPVRVGHRWAYLDQNLSVIYKVWIQIEGSKRPNLLHLYC